MPYAPRCDNGSAHELGLDSILPYVNVGTIEALTILLTERSGPQSQCVA